MAQGRMLVILSNAPREPCYLRELAAEGYFVHAVENLDCARYQLTQRPYDILVYDIADEQATLAEVAALQPRNGAPLVLQGSPYALGRMLLEYSSAENTTAFDVDALVFKSCVLTELRIALKELIGQSVLPHRHVANS